jgi:hypothetical protein
MDGQARRAAGGYAVKDAGGQRAAAMADALSLYIRVFQFWLRPKLKRQRRTSIVERMF